VPIACRWRMAVILALAVLVGGCALAPSMIGFPHPNPAPASGDELAVLAAGGGGSPGYGYGAGGLSWAHSFGDVGFTASTWAAVLDEDSMIVGLHMETALRIAPVTDVFPDSFVLVGAGIAASPLPEEYLRPQVTVGILGSPAPGREGGVLGARLSAGAAIDVCSGYGSFEGVPLHLSFGGGYRWSLAEDTTFLDLQVEPFLEIVATTGPVFWSFGGHVMLGVAFDV